MLPGHGSLYAGTGTLGVGINPGIPNLIHRHKVAVDVLEVDDAAQDMRLVRAGLSKRLLDLRKALERSGD